MPAMTPSGVLQRWDAYRASWNLLFQKNLTEIPTFWERFATMVPSDTAREEYIWMDRLPQMRKWLGERIFANPAVRLQEIENELFELSVNIKRTQIEDDKLHVYDAIIPELARAAKIWPDIQVSTALQAGTTTVVYDGADYFSASHPVDMDNTSKCVSGTAYTTQSNLFTSTASGNQPGALPLTAANLAIAYQTMTSWVGPDLAPMYVVPDLLLVPPQLKFTAAEILHGDLIGKDIKLGGASTDTNGAAAVSNAMKGSMDMLVLPYLANDPTSYYLACTTRATKPFVFQLRESPETIIATRPTDHDVFMHDEYKYGVRARGAAGYSQWFLCAKAMAT
jgi:phage major head subunit gpT-like protein